jgi:hypothetical protein
MIRHVVPPMRGMGDAYGARATLDEMVFTSLRMGL